LKIDKDCFVDKQWIQNYVDLILSECRRFNITILSIRMCNSRRKGLHFYIKVSPPIDADLANQLQWLLGDDCQRVDFNRARIDSGLDEWSKLFEVPHVRLRTIYRHDCSRNRCLNVALGEDGLTS